MILLLVAVVVGREDDDGRMASIMAMRIVHAAAVCLRVSTVGKWRFEGAVLTMVPY